MVSVDSGDLYGGYFLKAYFTPDHPSPSWRNQLAFNIWCANEKDLNAAVELIRQRDDINQESVEITQNPRSL